MIRLRKDDCWQELFDHPVLTDAADPRHDDAWTHVQALIDGGRLATDDIRSVMWLMAALTITPTADDALTTMQRLGQEYDAPADDGGLREALPRLDEGLIEAALVAHYGKSAGNIDGVCLTVNGRDWSFREGFKRMWAGVRAELRARQALSRGE